MTGSQKYFLGWRAFDLLMRQNKKAQMPSYDVLPLLVSLTAQGRRALHTLGYSRRFKYFGPVAKMPEHVFNKGRHYGFQMFRHETADVLLNRESGRISDDIRFSVELYLIHPVVAIVQPFGTVREFDYTFSSTHMAIREIAVSAIGVCHSAGSAVYNTHFQTAADRSKFVRELESRYQCEVSVICDNLQMTRTEIERTALQWITERFARHIPECPLLSP